MIAIARVGVGAAALLADELFKPDRSRLTAQKTCTRCPCGRVRGLLSKNARYGITSVSLTLQYMYSSILRRKQTAVHVALSIIDYLQSLTEYILLLLRVLVIKFKKEACYATQPI